MEFASFVSFFFVAAFCLMPIVGFSYKVCEGVYKRSLFAKAAKQIQLFSACLLMLAGIAFCTDYFLQGILFRADLALAAGSMWGIGLRPLLLLSGGLCAAAVLCFAAVKFSKSLFWYVISAAGGIAVAVFAAQWINLAAISAAAGENADTFSQYCLQFLGRIFAVPAGSFADNAYALLSSVQFFAYAAALFLFLFIFLYALYFVTVLSFACRNAMDYGRDFYAFMLNKYGRAIFVFSLFAFAAGLVLLVGYMLPFQPALEQLLRGFSASAYFYVQLACVLVPFLYMLFSLKLKKNFCLAAVPMQKKSCILAVFAGDLFFGAYMFFLIMNAAVL